MIGHIKQGLLGLFPQIATQALALKTTTKRVLLYQRIALCICLLMALFSVFSISDSVRAGVSHGKDYQSDSPLSPIALVDQGAATSADQSITASGSVVEGVYRQIDSDGLPLMAGTQANQTSLVLVGAVLVALLIVVGLAVNRKEV